MTLRPTPPEISRDAVRLLDSLRSGAAPRLVRLKGARGELAPSLEEKAEILVILSQDPDDEIRRVALATLSNLDRHELAAALADPRCPPTVLEYFANQCAGHHEALWEALLDALTLDEQVESSTPSRLGELPHEMLPEASPAGDPLNPAGDGHSGQPRETTLQKIAHMTAAEKIKCALTGSQEERLILIRDANKVVARAVVQSPKLSEAEIEAFAAMKNISEEVLRLIATNRSFTKSYAVVRALLSNPRTPLDVSLPMMNRLNERDMKSLAVNKNIPDALRTNAAKLLAARLTARTSPPRSR